MKISLPLSFLLIFFILIMGCSQPTTHNTLLSPVPTTRPIVPVATTIQTTSTPTPLPTLTTTPVPTAAVTQVLMTITHVDTPDTASYFCNSDKCGTLMISVTCNPRMLFRRVAILKIKNPNNATERSAAVAAMGNNFADVLPDGLVNPVNINPGSYTLVLLNEKNVQVPQSRIISSMGSVSVTTGKITKYVFKADCT